MYFFVRNRDFGGSVFRLSGVSQGSAKTSLRDNLPDCEAPLRNQRIRYVNVYACIIKADRFLDEDTLARKTTIFQCPHVHSVPMMYGVQFHS